jgi:DNA-binding protein WhiA
LSFTRQVKQELVRQRPKPLCCGAWELIAFLQLRGYLTIGQGRQILSIRAEDTALARYLFSLLKTAGIAAPAVLKQQQHSLGRKIYLVQVDGEESIEALLVYLGMKEAGRMLQLDRPSPLSIPRRCCRRAYARGAFLAGGSLSIAGSSGYHLEINCSYQEDAACLRDGLSQFSLRPFLRRHNGCYSLYLKNAEAIADFLRVIGANSSLLELESARVVKSMRNQVNRLVNCDTANLEKIVSSAQQQLRAIELIERRVGLSNLPSSLREAARLRRRYPEASLKELGEKMEPPLGKSGMNHRFRQLGHLARQWDQKHCRN